MDVLLILGGLLIGLLVAGGILAVGSPLQNGYLGTGDELVTESQPTKKLEPNLNRH